MATPAAVSTRESAASAWNGATLLRLLLAMALVAVASGSACALFLWLLDWAQWQRHHTPWLIMLLPVAGVAIVMLYRHWGSESDQGMELIMSSAAQPQAARPIRGRLAPLILLTTIGTHVFGGSAGREGTAVQMGGGLAASIGRWLAIPYTEHQRLLLIGGMAGGFAALFGTPLAAAVFALEVVRLGLQQRLGLLLPALAVAIAANAIAHAWGAKHAPYPQLLTPDWQLEWWHWRVVRDLVVIALSCALVARLFIVSHHLIKHTLARWCPRYWLAPLIGGLVVLLLVGLTGSRDYLGLGVSNPDPQAVSILSSFHAGGAEATSWLYKLIFTTITLGSGFKGGEVTPLFFIGATLGNSLATVLSLPTAFLAGLGMMALFAAASRAPLACAVMGAELFGWNCLPFLLPVCYGAYFGAGRHGIYPQRPPQEPTKR